MSDLAKPLVIDAAAVDIGFFATKFTLGRQKGGGSITVDQFPSEVAPAPTGIVRMPLGKRPDGFVVEVDAVRYFVGKDVADMTRSYGARAVSTDYSTTPSYKALFLGALAYLATHFGATTRIDIKHMVVGLPLSTVGSHRAALKRMVEATHRVPIAAGEHQVEIHIQRGTVIAQPMGALLSAGLGTRQRPNGDNPDRHRRSPVVPTSVLASERASPTNIYSAALG